MDIIELGERCRKLGLKLLIRTHEENYFSDQKWFIHVFKFKDIELKMKESVLFLPDTFYREFTNDIKSSLKSLEKALDELE